MKVKSKLLDWWTTLVLFEVGKRPEDDFIAALTSDIGPSLPSFSDIDFWNSLEINVWVDRPVWDLYSVKVLSKKESWIYLSIAFVNESFEEAPDHEKVIYSNAFIKNLINKWMEERIELKKNPKKYQEAIDLWEKVFEIDE